MKKILFVATLMVWGLMFAGTSSAATASANLQVNATVVGTCTVSTTAVDFGNATGELDTYSTGNITVSCTAGTPFNIALGGGNHFGEAPSASSARAVSDGGALWLAGYDLYKDANHQDLWGDADFDSSYPAANSMGDVGTGADVSYPVYGALFAFIGEGIPTGTILTDTVTVTVYY